MTKEEIVEARIAAALNRLTRHHEGLPLKTLANVCKRFGGQPGSLAKILEQMELATRHLRFLRGGLTVVTPTLKAARKIGIHENVVRQRGSLGSDLGVALLWEVFFAEPNLEAIRLFFTELKELVGAGAKPAANAAYLACLKPHPCIYRAFLVESSTPAVTLRSLRKTVDKLERTGCSDIKLMAFTSVDEVAAELKTVLAISDLKNDVLVRMAPKATELNRWLKGVKHER